VEAAAARALDYVQNSVVPQHYVYLYTALDDALQAYEGAGSTCAASSLPAVPVLFVDANSLLKKSVAILRADGGRPGGMRGRPNPTNWAYEWRRSSAPPQSLPTATAPESYPMPTPEVSGPPGCPSSAALMAAWNSAPASARAQSISPDLHISAFNDITCWQGWVVASAITNANGFQVFAEHGGLHLLLGAGMRQFNRAVCSSAKSPHDWKGPAGPANCSATSGG
jgi:hypothetical protein